MPYCKEWQVHPIKVATMGQRARIGEGVRSQPGLSREMGEGRGLSTKRWWLVCQDACCVMMRGVQCARGISLQVDPGDWSPTRRAACLGLVR
jgi:hypothetical protein